MAEPLLDQTPAEEAPSERRVNVLLVDDRPANLLSLKALLAELNVNPVEARSGEEALRRLLADDFAVILLGVHPPELDGIETARRIRGCQRSRSTPIIFLTGQDDGRLPAEQAYALGAVDYLVKPLVPVILRAKVAGFVELFEKTEQVKRQADRIRQIERRDFERKLAAENARLRESEERFRAIFSQATVGIAQTDLAGRFVLANERYCDIVGYSRAELLGLDFQAITHPEDLPQNVAAFERMVKGEMNYTIEKRYVRKDGSAVWVRNAVSAVRDRLGRPVYVLAIVDDISERKRLEEDVRRRMAQLAEADRRKDEFLAMLAHELRNPLAPIRSSLEVMRDPRASAAQVGQAREMTERQVGHMARLLDDLLDVSRINRGKIELRTEVVGLAALVGRTVEAVRPLAEERGHELTVSLPPAELRVKADPTRLEQVLTNLLSNAVKYTDPGGRVGVSAGREGDVVVLRVRDSGIGIAPDMLPRVFDLFVQAERRLDRSRGGVGIGLTLVKRLVELHGGTAEAFSAGLGRGTEFVVRLPAPEAEAGGEARPDEGSAAPPPATAPRRVLVVDDNVDAADSLALLLRLGGQAVRVAYDGPTALLLARGFLPEVALLDLGMPGMDGFEVARQLRRQPGLEKTVLVAVTGWGREEDRRQSEQAGFDHHLVKPIQLDVLRQVLAR